MYADSFFSNNGTWLNLTKNVPKLLFWYTTHKHYEHLPRSIYTDKTLHCDRIGERKFHEMGFVGIQTMKDKYVELLPEVILTGKLVAYEKAMIFHDERLHNYVISYDSIDKVDVYDGGKSVWADF